MAVEPELLLPYVALPASVSPRPIVSQRWPALTLHLNVVPSWSRAHRFAVLAGVIVEGPAGWVVRPVAETYVEAERGAPSATVSGLGGVIAALTASLRRRGGRVATVLGNGVVEVPCGLDGTFRSDS